MRKLLRLLLVLSLCSVLCGCSDKLEDFKKQVVATYEDAKDKSALDYVGGENYNEAKTEAYEENASFFRKAGDKISSLFVKPGDGYKERRQAKLNDKITDYVNNNEAVKEEAESKYNDKVKDDVENNKPLLIIALVCFGLIFIVLLLIILKRRKPRPVAVKQPRPVPVVDNPRPTVAKVKSSADLSVNYDKLLDRKCKELGLDKKDMIAKYGSARAAVEAVNLM